MSQISAYSVRAAMVNKKAESKNFYVSEDSSKTQCGNYRMKMEY